MRKFVLVILMIFCFSCAVVKAQETHLLDSNLIDMKIDLENLYTKASSQGKLSKSDMTKLNSYAFYALSKKDGGNTNILPILYLSGNTYRALKHKDEAIECYRTIVEYYPTSSLVRKSLIDLKHYGITYTLSRENGVLKFIPSDAD